jgi:hypothetical protein
MAGPSEGFSHADTELILQAQTEWSIRTRDEPDDYLISLAITLYEYGNDTPKRTPDLEPLRDLTVKSAVRV